MSAFWRRASPPARWGLLRLLASWLLLASGTLLLPRAAHAAIDWADDASSAINPGADLGSASYSTWNLQADRVTVRFLLPKADAERVAGSDIEVVVQQRLGDYLLQHLAVRAGASPCPAIDQGYDIGRVDPLTVGAGLYGFEIFFGCGQSGTNAQPSGVTLEDHALFERLPGQVNFASVQIGAGALQRQLFTRAHQQLALPLQGAASPAPLSRYLGFGFARMLGGWDRLCFLLGSVLLLRRAREGLALVSGLTIGLALCLPATLLADLIPRGQLAGSAVGLLIALVASEIIARHIGRTRQVVIAVLGALLCLAALILIAHARWPVLLLVGGAIFAGGWLGAAKALPEPLRHALLPAVFAFLEGFVLPSALAPLQLSAPQRLPLVASFDLGALLAAAGLVAVLLLARGAALRWPGPAPLMRMRALASDGAAAALGGLGVFWMLSRLHG